MIEGLKPYPDYQPSAIRFVGHVPGHWTQLRAKCLYREIDDRSPTGKEELLSVSHISGIRKRCDSNATMFLAKSNVGHKVCKSGDLIINTMWAWMGALGISEYSGIVSPAYGVYRRTKEGQLLDRYVHHLLRTPSYINEFIVRSTGIHSSRLRLYPEHFLRIPLAIPPIKEQAAIVRFLDHANRRIDRYIRAKRKLIALLNEQKQAIIQRAVTRGLDPNVPMKDSGVPWIGRIPAHWEILPVGRFASVGNGSTPSRSTPSYWNNGSYPWLNSSQVNRASIQSSDQFVTKTALAECHLPRVPAGSLLMAITGQGKTRGMVASLEFEATINQHLAFISPRPGHFHVDFLQSFLSAAYPELRRISDNSGSTKGALTCEDLKRFKVVRPPSHEQDALASRVRQETKVIEDAARKALREIDLLIEYRSRLNADVVTGQLDVREAARDLPDLEPEASTGADELEVDIDAAEDEAA